MQGGRTHLLTITGLDHPRSVINSHKMSNATIVLHPSEIYFTQNSVSDTFSDGTTIQERLDDLIQGNVFKWEIPMMKIVFRWGRWWSLNNRRLLVFKMFKNCGPVKAEIVPWAELDKEMWNKKLTTDNQGVFVRVRESEAGDCHNVSVCQCSCHLYYSDSDDNDSDCCELQESMADVDSETEDYYY